MPGHRSFGAAGADELERSGGHESGPAQHVGVVQQVAEEGQAVGLEAQQLVQGVAVAVGHQRGRQ